MNRLVLLCSIHTGTSCERVNQFYHQCRPAGSGGFGGCKQVRPTTLSCCCAMTEQPNCPVALRSHSTLSPSAGQALGHVRRHVQPSRPERRRPWPLLPRRHHLQLLQQGVSECRAVAVLAKLHGINQRGCLPALAGLPLLPTTLLCAARFWQCQPPGYTAPPGAGSTNQAPAKTLSAMVQQTLALPASAISLEAYSAGVAQQACAALATSLGTDPVCSASTSVLPSGRRLLQVRAMMVTGFSATCILPCEPVGIAGRQQHGLPCSSGTRRPPLPRTRQ